MSDWTKATLHALSEFPTQGVFSTDADLNVRAWNRWLERHSGYRAEEVIGRNLLDLYPDLVTRQMEGFFRTALKGKVAVLSQRLHRYLLPMPAKKPSGLTHMPQSARISPLCMQGSIVGAVAVIDDVSERVEREEELKDQLAMQEALSEIDRAILTLDLDECLRRVVNTTARLTRADHAMIVLKEEEGLRIRANSDDGRLCKTVDECLETGIAAKTVQSGHPIWLPDAGRGEDGRLATSVCHQSLSVAALPLIVENEPIGALMLKSSSPEGFTERDRKHLLAIALQAAIAIKNARLHTAMMESEQRYRTISEQSMLGVFLIRDNRLRYVNPAMARILGYSAEEIVGGLQFKNIIHPEDLSPVLDRMRRRIDGEGMEVNYEFRIRRSDGAIRHVEVFSRRIAYKGTTATLGTLLDVTDRKCAEEERARLATAIEQAGEGIFISDTDWTIRYVNPAFERISGYSRDEIIGKKSSILKSGKHDRAFYRAIWDMLVEGRTWSGRFFSRKKDGALYEIEATISPVRNNQGEIISFVSVERDITKEVQMENQFRQVQKMEAIGTLAGGIAHDFNNILAAILGYSELLRLDTAERSHARQNLDQVLNAAHRAKDLVRQILNFSRQSEGKREPVSISPIIKETLKLLRASLPATIEIRQDLTGLGPAQSETVLADPIQIHQIIMNLCTNAAHAMGEKGGILTINAGKADFDEKVTAEHVDLKPGSYVRLTVRDTGHGMSVETMNRIFEPFYTTKGVGEGTGMGLSVVHGIVKSHGGAITVESDPGRGSAFDVYLPRMAGRISTKLDKTQPVSRGSGRVLFVDDEAPLVEMWEKMLLILGYDVVGTTSSTDALELFRAEPNRFDLVILDHTMPKMTGSDLACMLKRIRPEIPVILCTGSSSPAIRTKVKETGIQELLIKPIDVRAMSEAIHRALG